MLEWEKALPAGYEWLIFLARIVLAVLLGFAIGFERKIRGKEAGVRTHSLVAAGSCLFMIISKYAFADIGGSYDVQRIAAQVVSGVGFLGAGIIMYRRQAIHGLTTAAVVWVTAGVGMAAGAGMYILAASTAVIVIGVQCILHIPCRLFQMKRYMQLKVVFAGGHENIAKIKELFGAQSFNNFEVKNVGNEVVCKAIIKTTAVYDASFIYTTLSENDFIKSIERVDDEE